MEPDPDGQLTVGNWPIQAPQLKTAPTPLPPGREMTGFLLSQRMTDSIMATPLSLSPKFLPVSAAPHFLQERDLQAL